MTAWRRFLAAVGFLTRVPLPTDVLLDEGSLAGSPPMFPVVGALIGIAVAGFDRLAGSFLPRSVAAAADLVAIFLLTGGLHLDGLLDTADGVFSGKSGDKALEIMKDSRVGAMGVSVGILLVCLKVTALASLAGGSRFQALLVAPALGRYAMVIGMDAFPYARTGGGLGSLFKTGARGRWAALSGLFPVALAVAVAGVRGAAASTVVALTALSVGRFVSKKLGGLTGDVYGALCETAEAAVYLLFAVRW